MSASVTPAQTPAIASATALGLDRVTALGLDRATAPGRSFSDGNHLANRTLYCSKAKNFVARLGASWSKAGTMPL